MSDSSSKARLRASAAGAVIAACRPKSCARSAISTADRGRHELFGERGYAATPIEAVCSHAKVSTGISTSSSAGANRSCTRCMPRWSPTWKTSSASADPRAGPADAACGRHHRIGGDVLVGRPTTRAHRLHRGRGRVRGDGEETARNHPRPGRDHPALRRADGRGRHAPGPRLSPCRRSLWWACSTNWWPSGSNEGTGLSDQMAREAGSCSAPRSSARRTNPPKAPTIRWTGRRPPRTDPRDRRPTQRARSPFLERAARLVVEAGVALGADEARRPARRPRGRRPGAGSTLRYFIVPVTSCSGAAG